MKRFVRIEVGRKGPSMKVFVYCTLLMLPMAYPAYGAILITAPVVRGSIQDLPVDGNPDSIANTSNIVTSNDAANGDSNGVAEFDISSLTGPAGVLPKS